MPATAHWKRIDRLLAAALALPVAKRENWLRALATEDRTLVAPLLSRADDDTFMAQPVRPALAGEAAGTPEPQRRGDLLGPYRLVAPLGRGGMGTVWKAERIAGGDAVALKLLRGQATHDAAAHLKRECEVLATLAHPGIASVLDAGIGAAGQPYIVMRMIEGMRIDRHCERSQSDAGARIALVLQAAEALAYAHARLVIHGDLKPSNLLVDASGSVHVVDFGIAQAASRAACGGGCMAGACGAQPSPAAPEVATENRFYTPGYAPPEQAAGERLTTGSDVYSLAMVLRLLLAGGGPRRLKGVLARALEPDPELRFRSMDAFAAALRGQRSASRP